MFRNLFRVGGLCALILFAHAQYQGWNLFDETADRHSGSPRGSGRVYHK